MDQTVEVSFPAGGRTFLFITMPKSDGVHSLAQFKGSFLRDKDLETNILR
jgi:hypothetical protein